jgi:hypothetical protein
MVKYLVIWQIPTGMAQISNVRVVEASSADTASRKAQLAEKATGHLSNFPAYRLDELEDGFSFYH